MQWKNPTEFKTDVRLIFTDRKFGHLIDNNLYHSSLLKNEQQLIGSVIEEIINDTKCKIGFRF
jgi:hypothetical protein